MGTVYTWCRYGSLYQVWWGNVWLLSNRFTHVAPRERQREPSPPFTPDFSPAAACGELRRAKLAHVVPEAVLLLPVRMEGRRWVSMAGGAPRSMMVLVVTCCPRQRSSGWCGDDGASAWLQVVAVAGGSARLTHIWALLAPYVSGRARLVPV
jgi:hypothetical protein